MPLITIAAKGLPLGPVISTKATSMAEFFLGGHWDAENGFQCLERVSPYPKEFIMGKGQDKRDDSSKGKGKHQHRWIKTRSTQKRNPNGTTTTYSFYSCSCGQSDMRISTQ